MPHVLRLHACADQRKKGYLVMVAYKHEGGLLPVSELLKHPVERVHGEHPPHMPKVACKVATC